MATRSSIAYTTPKGIRAIYCHNDGYLSHNGKILLENYTAAFKVGKLVEHGDMSVLAPELVDCVFYARDRGEAVEATETTNYDSIEEWADSLSGCEYFYLYDSSKGEWLLSVDGLEFEPLASVLELA